MSLPSQSANPAPLTLEQTLALGQPLDVDDARTAARMLAGQRRSVEIEHKRAAVEASDKLAEYRKAHAQSFVSAEGRTAAEREANAKAACADAERDRDLADRMVKVWAQRLEGIDGERSLLKDLISWSARMADTSAPSVEGHTFGRRAA